MGGDAVPIERIQASAYKIPTDGPEADGTFRWDATTLVLVEVYGGGKQGLGYSYTAPSTAKLIDDVLAPVVKGRDALSVKGSWAAMLHEVRNLGRPGMAASAIAAVDVALWDLKARLLDLPVIALLGQVHDGVTVYGSGGFTSYTDERLHEQLEGWVNEGIRMVKMKVGTHPDQDLQRVETARDAIGDDIELFVDANGSYDRKQALWFADAFADLGVVWFEEPVTSDDLEGLRLMRDRAPSGMDITAGEYGYDLFYFRRMLDAGAVDVLQADATRCLGYSGFLRAATLCEAHALPLSAHTAPNLHVHAACAALPACNIEYFYDHVRIEQMLFEGTLNLVDGCLRPDRTRAGLGLSFKHAVAEPYRIYGSPQS